MGKVDLTLAQADHPPVPGGLCRLHRRDVPLVPGDGRGGPLDSLQLTGQIGKMTISSLENHISVHRAEGLDSGKFPKGPEI